MTPLSFSKYQGAGNDFVLVDQRQTRRLARSDRALVAWLCDRRFGIGADGLILLETHPDYDFEMVYFNADGGEGSLCGNGGRCVAAFARHLGVISGDSCRFLASDGPHEARFTRSLGPGGEWVELHMADVAQIERRDDSTFVLDTGSPHYVRFLEPGALATLDVVQEGRAVRNSERFRAAGINVNFSCADPAGGLAIRTYERGVEDETLACGTGVTAAALAWYSAGGNDGVAASTVELPVHARGGQLAVRFRAEGGAFRDIWLCGPAQRVFEGRIDLELLITK